MYENTRVIPCRSDTHSSQKKQPYRDIKDVYGFDVAAIRTLITPKGKKKAIVTFTDDDAATEIATRIGLF